MPQDSNRPDEPIDRTIRILSIDGGGIRGILPARLLQEIETRTAKPAADLFHMIAGTSTGGILACGLLAGLPARQLGDLYANHGGEIFAHSFWRTVVTVRNLDGPKYQPDALEKKLQGTLGDTWLSETKGAELLVPSYCIHLPKPIPLDGNRVQSTRLPYLFKSWKARGTALNDGDHPPELDFMLRDIARATSAAPTYFPPAGIKNKAGDTYWMVDGGVFANNPAMCALTSARKIFPSARRYLLVSLGTGSLEREISSDEAGGWGEIGWLHPILSILMDGSADTVCYEVDEMLGEEDHKRFEVSLGSDPNDPVAVHEEFDDATPDNIRRLEALAGKQIGDAKEKLDALCAELMQPKWDTKPVG